MYVVGVIGETVLGVGIVEHAAGQPAPVVGDHGVVVRQMGDEAPRGVGVTVPGLQHQQRRPRSLQAVVEGRPRDGQGVSGLLGVFGVFGVSTHACLRLPVPACPDGVPHLQRPPPHRQRVHRPEGGTAGREPPDEPDRVTAAVLDAHLARAIQ